MCCKLKTAQIQSGVVQHACHELLDLLKMRKLTSAGAMDWRRLGGKLGTVSTAVVYAGTGAGSAPFFHDKSGPAESKWGRAVNHVAAESHSDARRKLAALVRQVFSTL